MKGKLSIRLAVMTFLMGGAVAFWLAASPARAQEASPWKDRAEYDAFTAITQANVNMAKGSFDGPARASTIDANDQLTHPDAFRTLVIAWRNGAPVHLSDVAQVVDGPENTKIGAWVNRSAGAHAPVARFQTATEISIRLTISPSGASSGRTVATSSHAANAEPSGSTATWG